MLYYYFKIFHIFSAALLLTSMVYSYHLWKQIQQPQDTTAIASRIQTQTWSVIVPLTIVQLATGFTMISLKHYDLSQFWIIGSIAGFMILIASWFSFIYFLLLAQQVPIASYHHASLKFYRRAQSMMLLLCALALLSMIFLMVSATPMAHG